MCSPVQTEVATTDIKKKNNKRKISEDLVDNDEEFIEDEKFKEEVE